MMKIVELVKNAIKLGYNSNTIFIFLKVYHVMEQMKIIACIVIYPN